MQPADPKTITKHYSSNLEFFRLVAGKYLHIGVFESEDEEVDVAKQRTIDELVAWSGLTSTSHVLDLGSGTGTSALHLAQTHGCSVVGVDPAQELVDFANAEMAPDQKSLVRFECGRAEAIPFEDASFDLLLSIEVLCHTEDIDDSLGECARVLKPGGTLVFSDLVMIGEKTPHSDFYFEFSKLARIPDSLERYKKRLEENGFTNVEFKNQSRFLKNHFQAGLKRVTANRADLVSKFGVEKFKAVREYCSQATSPEFLAEMGWGWFKAVRS